MIFPSLPSSLPPFNIILQSFKDLIKTDSHLSNNILWHSHSNNLSYMELKKYIEF